jgi:putative holliday junction resolvase
MRVVGLDVGERRIGMAVSDATRTLARPMSVLQIARLDAAAVTRVADEIGRLATEDDGVEAIVVGLPRRLDGRANNMTAHVQTFAAALGSRTGLPVSLQDERLTSHEAEMRLAELDKDWRSRKKRLDAAAAAIILQEHLDGLPR